MVGALFTVANESQGYAVYGDTESTTHMRFEILSVAEEARRFVAVQQW